MMEDVMETDAKPSNTPVDRKPIDIGALSIRIDSSSVDEFVDRLERAISAFKAEWNSKN